MPVYDYLCDRCGPFTEMKPMAEADLPHKCPTCRKKAPRAFLTAAAATVVPDDRCATASSAPAERLRRFQALPAPMDGAVHATVELAFAAIGALRQEPRP